jgi:acetylornithine/succinyldiaminopimelate/putrescine aminotransferase
LLIHDEVQSGCGRSGSFLYADRLEVHPDLLTLAKPIAAGLPMGLCLASKELAGTLEPGDHGSTFAGGPLACRAALVFLDALDQGLQDAVLERGAQLDAGLRRLALEFPVVTELRGVGLIRGLRLARGASDLRDWLFAQGMIVNVAAGDVLRLLPAFVIEAAQIDAGLALLRDGLSALPSDPKEPTA